MNWIRLYARKLETLKSPCKPIVIEMDEMHSYIGQKNTVGSGLLLIDWKSGYSALSLAAEQPKRE